MKNKRPFKPYLTKNWISLPSNALRNAAATENFPFMVHLLYWNPFFANKLGKILMVSWELVFDILTTSDQLLKASTVIKYIWFQNCPKHLRGQVAKTYKSIPINKTYVSQTHKT